MPYAAETTTGNSCATDRAISLSTVEYGSGTIPGTIVIMGIGAVVRAALVNFLAVFRIIVPVVKTVLFVGVDVTVFLAATA
jgi:hypothetical protein